MMQNAQQYLAGTDELRFRKGVLYPFIASQINSDSLSLLDLGCGFAPYHSLILDQNPQIQRLVGIEISEQMLSKAKNLHKTQYLCKDATNFTLAEKFQQIISVFLIEHLNLQKLLNLIKSSKAHLKPKGFLKIFSIDTNVLLKSSMYPHLMGVTVESEGGLKDGQTFNVKIGEWINLDTYWSPSFLTNELQKNNFKITIKYVNRQLIKSEFYTPQESKQIQEAVCIYCLVAQLQE